MSESAFRGGISLGEIGPVPFAVDPFFLGRLLLLNSEAVLHGLELFGAV